MRAYLCDRGERFYVTPLPLVRSQRVFLSSRSGGVALRPGFMVIATCQVDDDQTRRECVDVYEALSTLSASGVLEMNPDDEPEADGCD